MEMTSTVGCRIQRHRRDLYDHEQKFVQCVRLLMLSIDEVHNGLGIIRNSASETNNETNTSLTLKMPVIKEALKSLKEAVSTVRLHRTFHFGNDTKLLKRIDKNIFAMDEKLQHLEERLFESISFSFQKHEKKFKEIETWFNEAETVLTMESNVFTEENKEVLVKVLNEAPYKRKQYVECKECSEKLNVMRKEYYEECARKEIEEFDRRWDALMNHLEPLTEQAERIKDISSHLFIPSVRHTGMETAQSNVVEEYSHGETEPPEIESPFPIDEENFVHTNMNNNLEIHRSVKKSIRELGSQQSVGPRLSSITNIDGVSAEAEVADNDIETNRSNESSEDVEVMLQRVQSLLDLNDIDISRLDLISQRLDDIKTQRENIERLLNNLKDNNEDQLSAKDIQLKRKLSLIRRHTLIKESELKKLYKKSSRAQNLHRQLKYLADSQLSLVDYDSIKTIINELRLLISSMITAYKSMCDISSLELLLENTALEWKESYGDVCENSIETDYNTDVISQVSDKDRNFSFFNDISPQEDEHKSPRSKHKDFKCDIEEMKTIFENLQNRNKRFRNANVDENYEEAKNNSLDKIKYKKNSLTRSKDIDETNNLINQLLEWVCQQSEIISRLCSVGCDSKLTDDLHSRYQEMRVDMDTKRLNVKQAIKQSERILEKFSNSDILNVGTLSSRKDIQALSRNTEQLYDEWKKLETNMMKFEKQFKSTIKRLQDFSQKEHLVLDILNETEKRGDTNNMGLCHSSKDIPRQIESNKLLLQNLNQQEHLLQELNDTFHALKDEGYENSVVSVKRVNELNGRWKNLVNTLSSRIHALKNLVEKVPPSSFNMAFFDMEGSVEPPWKRSVASNDYPYYVNIQTLVTSWDHPEMISLINSLSYFNEVRFCAYRTAMKLRAVQKRLCLDMCDLEIIAATFDSEGMTQPGANKLTVARTITIIRRMYEAASVLHPRMINVPQTTDLCLNWLIKLYDQNRKGGFHVNAFKTALTLMSRASIEDKYKYIFEAMADPNEHVMSIQGLGIFIHNSLMIPKMLGEVAAFGGSRIEPSIRSYLDFSGNQENITLNQFLKWMQLEPQSLVWLPVMHRLAASETTRHEAKCNICKEYPIIGFRYRSLKRFNFDVCQKCFFFGKTSNGYKVDDSLQEYYLETTSGEDIRDFFRIFKNKFRRTSRNQPKLGYLPLPKTFAESGVSIIRDSNISQLGSREELMDTHPAPKKKEETDEEHEVVASYCDLLAKHKDAPKSPFIKSPSVDTEEKEDLEEAIQKLECENRMLREEYSRLTEEHCQNCAFMSPESTRCSVGDINTIKEAKFLRHYKNKLECRMKILEDHNMRLELQLRQLKQLISQKPRTVSIPQNGLPYSPVDDTTGQN